MTLEKTIRYTGLSGRPYEATAYRESARRFWLVVEELLDDGERRPVHCERCDTVTLRNRFATFAAPVQPSLL